VAREVLSRIDVLRLHILNSGLMAFLTRNAEMPSCFEMKVLYFGKAKVILHGGAHLGEESSLYRGLGAEKIFWVEAQPDKVAILNDLFGSRNVFSGVLAEESEIKVLFYVTSNSLSSSSRQINPNSWNVSVQEVIQLRTTTLDDVVRKIYLQDRILPDLLVLDLQGAEYEAILGGDFAISKIDFLIVEFANYQLYENQKTLPDIISILKSSSFEMFYKTENSGYGEALFVRTSRIRSMKRVQLVISRHRLLIKKKILGVLRKILFKVIFTLKN
jgi:FkbM family methyltransferase